MQYSVIQPKCPSHNVLEGISDKWSILIINFLENKVIRFGELKRSVPGISAKMLTQTLLKLEKYGFLSRDDHGTKPLKVEYQHTELGKELCVILKSLTSWTEQNMENILKSVDGFEKNKLS